MSDEHKQGGDEPSPASAGSVAVAGTLRDTFASAALTGLLSSLPNGDQYHSFAVERAWSLADAMLRERCNVKTPNDAMPMAGSGPTVPANDRASDCSEDGRVRASASSIGNTQEPVAWAVVSDSTEQIDCEFVYPDEATAGDVALDSNGGVVPLYRQPQPTLTDAEREAVIHAMAALDHVGTEWTLQCAATMRGLLERMK